MTDLETLSRENNWDVPAHGSRPSLLILGTRGVPAAHGGFETFAEKLALYLVERGWNVTVYCQAESQFSSGRWGKPLIDEWCGVRRVHFATRSRGALATIEFDWACTLHALHEEGVPLILGYNTAIFSLVLRAAGRPVLMNMDGIEWSRAKWSKVAKAWFYANEWIGAVTANNLIADHPVIADHLATRRSRSDIVMIPYGADEIITAPTAPVEALGLTAGNYFVSIGRIEPENSVLEMISAFVAVKRKAAFVCLGTLEPERNKYHASVIAAARGQVIFPGAIYEKERVSALRFHALAYCHGHTVGGTNPSLVEALGAGSAIIAHDNKFNRWVAGDGQLYFRDMQGCAEALSKIEDSDLLRDSARNSARTQFRRGFSWPRILESYESACSQHISRDGEWSDGLELNSATASAGGKPEDGRRR